LINSVYFSLLWALVPIFVTLMAFFWYVQYRSAVIGADRQLRLGCQARPYGVRRLYCDFSLRDVAHAAQLHPCICESDLLFVLVRADGQVVMILQAHVSVKRIEDFLGEDEGELGAQRQITAGLTMQYPSGFRA
jgi:hypothetical protein